MLNLFKREEQHSHPLAEVWELRKVLAELPVRDDARALDELAGWMESIGNSEGLTPFQLFDITRQLDDAAQPFLRHLTRAFLTGGGAAPAVLAKNAALCSDYYTFAADVLRHALDAYRAAESDKGKVKLVEALRPQLPLLLSRLMAVLGSSAKWRRFRHEPPTAGAWAALGACWLYAEERKIDGEPLTLYPLSQIVTTPRREYIKALVLDASSLDSLLPVQIEVAEKLVAHFAPQFVLSRDNRPDNIYWVDVLGDQPPQRLARLPKNTPGVRLLGFGEVPNLLAAMTRVVERGDLPSEVNLTQFTPKLVLSVLRHLASYWTLKPPLRKYQRHAVMSRLTVRHGFDACFERMGDGNATPGAEDFDFRALGDAWQVGDVSMGGFGARVPGARKEWLRIGALLAMQPEGADKWMVGIVRRCQRGADNATSVGVQTLARQASCHLLEVAGSPARSGMGERALLIDPADSADGVRVVLQAATFDLRESYNLDLLGRRGLLSPVELLESGPDYQLGRFRLRYAD